MTLLEMIKQFRAALGLPPLAPGELRADTMLFVQNALLGGDGYAWLGALLGGEIVASDGAIFLCENAELRTTLAKLPGCRAHALGVGLPFGAAILAAVFPGDVESEPDGRIRGWRFPVPVPGSTDAWGWQALEDQLFETEDDLTDWWGLR